MACDVCTLLWKRHTCSLPRRLQRSVCRCLGHIVIAVAVLVMAGQVPNIIVKGALSAFRVGSP